MEAFSGSQVDLEGAADNLFSSPPPLQHLRFESLSLKTPQTVPQTLGTASKIESRLEKSLGNQFNIQLQQQMGVFQASMLEAMKSLRDKMQSMKKASEAEVDKTSAFLSKAGPSKQPDLTMTQTSHPTLAYLTSRMLNQWTRTYMVLHFLQSSLKVSSLTMLLNTRILNPTITQIIIPRTTRNNLKGLFKSKEVLRQYYSQSSSSEEDQSFVPIIKSTKPQQKAPSEPEHQQDSTVPVFYREVDMSDLPFTICWGSGNF